MSNGSSPQGSGKITIEPGDTFKDWNFNIAQSGIVTTEDKVRLCLNDHLEKAENQKTWLIPFAVSISLLITLLTVSFRKVLWLSADFWQAIFIVSFVMAVAFTVYWFKKRGNPSSIDTIVEELKSGKKPQTPKVTRASGLTGAGPLRPVRRSKMP